MFDDCVLSSLDYCGPRFTLCNNKRDSYFTRERLDRMVANKESFNNHSQMQVIVFPTYSSDPCPILMKPEGKLIWLKGLDLSSLKQARLFLPSVVKLLGIYGLKVRGILIKFMTYSKS